MSVAVVELATDAAVVLGQALALAALGHAAARLGVLRRRPAAWAALWSIALVKLVAPWGPAVTGSLADLWARLAPDPALAAVVPAPASLGAPSGGGGYDLGAALLIAAWVVGAGWALVGRLGAQRRRLTQAARLPTGPQALQQQVGEVAARVDWRGRPPEAKIDPDPSIPHLVVGVRRAFLVVPEALLAEPALLELALAHELAHLRRRDHLARWLAAAVAAVWFFVPVRAVFGRALERAQEAAADALAARALGLAPAAYARRLVAATLRCQAAPAELAGALGLGPTALAERVEALCQRPSAAGPGWAGAIGVAAFALLALGGAGAGPTPALAQRCDYSPAIAEALREVHPEADLDGDGELGRDEACALQEQLRRSARQGLEPGGEQAASSLWQQLCCNCEGANERTSRGSEPPGGEPAPDYASPASCEQE